MWDRKSALFVCIVRNMAFKSVKNLVMMYHKYNSVKTIYASYNNISNLTLCLTCIIKTGRPCEPIWQAC